MPDTVSILVCLGSVLGAQELERSLDAFEVVPGVVYEEWRRDDPLRIYVLRLDLGRPELRLDAVPGHDDLTRRERPSAVAERLDRTGSRTVAAINGDLGGRGASPSSMLVRNGELLVSPSKRSVFVLDRYRRPHIGVFQTRFALLRRTENRAHVLAPAFMNRRDDFERGALFGPRWGASPAAEGAVDVLLRHDGTVTPRGSVEVDVVAIDAEAGGGTKIPPGHLCLQWRSTTPISMSEGERWSLTAQTTPEPGPWNLVLGGVPSLLTDGAVDVKDEGARRSFVVARHPRTAVGIGAERKRLIWVVVDGRRAGHSIGVTLEQLAEIMVALGAVEAINLDGGGSSTMVVAGAVMNRPSDEAGEREVSSALVLSSVATDAEPRRPR